MPALLNIATLSIVSTPQGKYFTHRFIPFIPIVTGLILQPSEFEIKFKMFFCHILVPFNYKFTLIFKEQFCLHIYLCCSHQNTLLRVFLEAFTSNVSSIRKSLLVVKFIKSKLGILHMLF